jgi:hypothetical protein
MVLIQLAFVLQIVEAVFQPPVKDPALSRTHGTPLLVQVNITAFVPPKDSKPTIINCGGVEDGWIIHNIACSALEGM